MDETEKSLSKTMLASDNQEMIQKMKKKKLSGDKKKKKRKRSHRELTSNEEKDRNLETNVGTDKKHKFKEEKSSSTTPAATSQNTKTTTTTTNTAAKKYLNGMIVAISTLDVQGQAHANVETSYKAVMSKCLEVGAQVTGQVHKRVHLVLSSRNTIQKQRLLTQRLRKALKKKIPIVDLEWLQECQKLEQRIDYTPYELTSLASQTQQEQLHIASEKKTNRKVVDKKDDEQKDEIDEYAGWSEPQELGCCCVCHENGDDNCKWCVDCSINKLKRLKQQNAEEEKQNKVDKKVKKKKSKKEKDKKKKKQSKRQQEVS